MIHNQKLLLMTQIFWQSHLDPLDTHPKMPASGKGRLSPVTFITQDAKKESTLVATIYSMGLYTTLAHADNTQEQHQVRFLSLQPTNLCWEAQF